MAEAPRSAARRRARGRGRPRVAAPGGRAVARGDRRGRTRQRPRDGRDRKSTRLNSSHSQISYAVFCLKKKKNTNKNLYSPLKTITRKTNTCTTIAAPPLAII